MNMKQRNIPFSPRSIFSDHEFNELNENGDKNRKFVVS